MNTELLKQYNNLYDVTERKALIADMLTAFREMNRLQKKMLPNILALNHRPIMRMKAEEMSRLRKYL